MITKGDIEGLDEMGPGFVEAGMAIEDACWQTGTDTLKGLSYGDILKRRNSVYKYVFYSYCLLCQYMMLTL